MAQNLKINILAKDKTKQALGTVQAGLTRLRGAIFSVQSAIIGIGGGLVVRSLLKTASDVEQLNVRFAFLFGNVKEGTKAFNTLINFAAKVPFSLEEISTASGNLAVVAKDAEELNAVLKVTGNVAAVTGLDFRQTAEQIQRSFAGGIAAADVFRERGVRQMLGFKAGATVTAEETVAAFEKVFGKGGRFGGATKELATTFTGTLSMLGDKLFNFKKDVAGEGFFDELKKEFKSLNQFIEDNSEAFESIAKAISATLTLAVKGFALAIKGVATAVNTVTAAYQGLLKVLNKLTFGRFEFLNVEARMLKKRLDSEFNFENIRSKAQRTREKDLKTLVKTKDVLQEIKDIMKGELDKLTNFATQFTKILNQGIKGFSKGLAESIVLGKNLNETMKNLGQTLLVNILSTIIEIVARKAVELAIEKEIINVLKIKKTLQSIGSVLGIFGKQAGGAVAKGRPTLVGERGPELFIPNSSGQITQNARGAGGGGVNVNFTINTIDSRGFDEALVENRGTITSIINNAMNEKGARGIV